jgi:hypothetical protein
MKATSVLWYFDRQLHKTYDKKYMDLGVGTKVAYINRAVSIFYDKVISNRSRNPLFEKWLRPLEVDGVNMKLIRKTSEYNHYEFPERFGTATLVDVYAKRDNCTAKFEASPLRDASASSALNNTMWEPSFDFEQTFRTSDDKGIKVFHKENFEIEKVLISYLKTVPEIHAGSLIRNDNGYIYHDGKRVTKDIDLDFGEGAFDPIVNIAVLLVEDNGQDFSLQVNKILNIKNIL